MRNPPSSNRSLVQNHTWPRILLMTVPTEFQVFSPVTDYAPCRVERDKMEAIYKSHKVSKGKKTRDRLRKPTLLWGSAEAFISVLADVLPLFLLGRQGGPVVTVPHLGNGVRLSTLWELVCARHIRRPQGTAAQCTLENWCQYSQWQRHQGQLTLQVVSERLVGAELAVTAAREDRRTAAAVGRGQQAAPVSGKVVPLGS